MLSHLIYIIVKFRYQDIGYKREIKILSSFAWKVDQSLLRLYWITKDRAESCDSDKFHQTQPISLYCSNT